MLAYENYLGVAVEGGDVEVVGRDELELRYPHAQVGVMLQREEGGTVKSMKTTTHITVKSMKITTRIL